MFDTVLVANRGEIAVRIIRTLRQLAIRAVAVYSDADAAAPHVRLADTAVRLGPAPAAESYLAADRILDAAARTGAQAVHPGYGFLSENAAFARACGDAGLTFVGPPPAAIEAMGDKIAAKRTVEAAGVPVVPGVHRPGLTDADIRAAADAIGYPVLVKAAAGGGGKGMRLVEAPAQLDEAVAAARRESRAAFGDDALLVERFVRRPRHVEIQVLADLHGRVVHLGERECSLQRRHQKIIEEAPSPVLDARRRRRMGAAAVEAARACGYTGAGTVEFILGGDDPDAFYFLEMNTRLQVEHPVTELVTGLDLVEWQLRIAAGEPLGFDQDDVRLRGHAVEARVYAEDPSRGFLPTGGTVVRLREPAGNGVRVDSGLVEGLTVGSTYDPLLAKVIAFGQDRAEALRRLDAALAETVILGVVTNVAFLRALLADPDVQSGALDTGLVERRLDDLTRPPAVEDVLAAAALLRAALEEPAGAVVDPFDLPGGWRLGAAAEGLWRFRLAGDLHEVRLRGHAADAQVAVDGGAFRRASAAVVDGRLLAALDGTTTTFDASVAGNQMHLARAGRTWTLREEPALAAVRGDRAGTGSGPVVAPMPGTVTVVHVADGDVVAAGQPLLVVEAMKMEHQITAPLAGTVALRVRQGQQVAMEDPLAVVTPEPTAASPEPTAEG